RFLSLSRHCIDTPKLRSCATQPRQQFHSAFERSRLKLNVGRRLCLDAAEVKRDDPGIRKITKRSSESTKSFVAAARKASQHGASDTRIATLAVVPGGGFRHLSRCEQEIPAMDSDI